MLIPMPFFFYIKFHKNNEGELRVLPRGGGVRGNLVLPRGGGVRGNLDITRGGGVRGH
jgi:hypothetical protein